MQIPRLHRRLIVLLGGFLIFVGLTGLGDGSDTVISTPEPVVATFKTDPGGHDRPMKELTSESATSETVDKVKAGDSLASIFSRNGFSAKDLHTRSARRTQANNSKTFFRAIDYLLYITRDS